jgi:metal-responsive CopG/Arc/MetJ family transcriptional regulator
VAGRKKFGDLTRAIGVRLDKPLLPHVDALTVVQATRGERGDVIRTIVEGWLLERRERSAAETRAEFEGLSLAVHKWRQGYMADLSEVAAKVNRARARSAARPQKRAAGGEDRRG